MSAPAAPANHQIFCSGSVLTIQTIVGPTYYVDDRGGPEHGNIWLYVESNGQQGLQPDVWAERAVGGDLPQECARPLPDSLIF